MYRPSDSYCLCVEGGKGVNWERRTWVTIYIMLKWDPEHVFLSVRLHGQLMDKQKPTCFLFHCTISCLFEAGQRLLSRLSLCYLFFFWLSDRVEYSLNLFAFSLKDLLVLLLGFVFFFVITRLGFLHSSVHINLFCSLWSSTSHIPLYLSLCVWLLGYALLTHCDSSALWTPCLPTDDHMLPQHRPGKLSLYSINFMMLVSSS